MPLMDDKRRSRHIPRRLARRHIRHGRDDLRWEDVDEDEDETTMILPPPPFPGGTMRGDGSPHLGR